MMPDKPKTLLIIDDDQGVAQAFRMMFRGHKYQILVASDCGAAFDLFKDSSTAVDLIVMDLMMTEVGGLECLAALKKKNIKAPVVVYSALSKPDICVEAMKLGAVDFVSKGRPSAEVKSRILAVLAAGTKIKPMVWPDR